MTAEEVYPETKLLRQVHGVGTLDPFLHPCLRKLEVRVEDLSEHSRAEAVRAFRAVAVVATAMAQSLEETPTNYGMQR